jgi:hypothetical protein
MFNIFNSAVELIKTVYVEASIVAGGFIQLARNVVVTIADKIKF